jgi:EAL domain-containing protein (putative c-di-GMP-specific phosphodiesterase class I)
VRALGGMWMAAQPIVRAADGGLYGHELLLRSDEPLLPNPVAVIRAAERLERLRELGAAVRAKIARLMADDALPGHAFVNLHPYDLLDEALLDPAAPLARFAPRVVFEVTERASLERVNHVAERVKALRQLGFRIALDDIGAGYAGLTSFAALSPDFVKLDRSLVHGISRHEIKQRLVSSLADVCRDLGVVLLAEGVETVAERDCVALAGCELLQGFLVGAPVRP